MTDLPRGPLGPLDPPPGAYEAVQRAAARRRVLRAGVAGTLSVALMAAAFGVGTLLGGSDEPDALVEAAGTPTPSASPAASAVPSPLPSPTPVPSPVASPSPSPSLPAAEHEYEPVYEGRVVDEAGRPVAGAWLVTVYPEGGVQAVRVGDDGTYEGQCGGPRELLAMWDLSRSGPVRQPRDMRNLAATWVGGGAPVPCASEQERRASGERLPVVTTVLREGGVLTGQLRYEDADGLERAYEDGAEPGGGLYCTSLLGDGGTQCASWDPVGGRYRFAGLPTGTYRLQGMHAGRSVEVRAGETTQLDWYECDGCARGERRPAPSPAATPAPSPS